MTYKPRKVIILNDIQIIENDYPFSQARENFKSKSLLLQVKSSGMSGQTLKLYVGHDSLLFSQKMDSAILRIIILDSTFKESRFKLLAGHEEVEFDIPKNIDNILIREDQFRFFLLFTETVIRSKSSSNNERLKPPPVFALPILQFLTLPHPLL